MASAQFVVDLDAGMDFFAGVAVGFEADAGFEQLDLRRELGLLGSGELGARFFGGFLRCLLSVRRKTVDEEERQQERGPQKAMNAEKKSEDGHAGSVGRGKKRVKARLRERCELCTSEGACEGRAISTQNTQRTQSR